MSFDKVVLKFASPALCGIKPSCLFSMTEDTFFQVFPRIRKWNQSLSAFGRKLVVLKTLCTYLIFVYDQNLLEKTVCEFNAISYLKEKNYPVNKGSEKILHELFRRLCENKSSGFPHEVGLFLGYPLEDVKCFERFGGRGSKYTGSWAVYGDVESACRKMKEYRKCSDECCALYDKGLNVVDISTNYKANIMKEVC
ncbi:DUF3793 family protein [Treponema sp.]|uniref:DUF3793 family protein n=1 Tax=Treponema sp. TaxID=166 RepID=UPI0025CB7F3D|nr:DUF3793 family protein [Treponema sp.]MCR5217655.1 DUF3793 family protein [Treponema sp.]